MATPPFTIDETIPGDSDIVSTHPTNARTFRDVIESYINTDHDFNTGHHNDVGLVEQAGDPGTVANTGWVYSKDVAGVTELFYKNSSGTTFQLTSAGALLLATNSVGSSQIAASAVDTSELAANSVDGTKIALGSDANGDLMYYNGTNWVRLAVGTASQVLKGGTIPTWGTALVAGSTLTLDPYALNTSTSAAHGLGATPDVVKVELECKTADGNWSVGNKIALNAAGTTADGAAARGLVFWWDTTNLYMITHSTNGLVIFDKTARSSHAITAASWKVTATPYKLS